MIEMLLGILRAQRRCSKDIGVNGQRAACLDEQKKETRGKQAGGRAHHSPTGKHAHPRW